ncbi:hypothetical protein [Streptosporangium sp. NPDC000396]|uniref:hypothetical protein n=1 Tax=Streptosporangium sp. NPDC000396 TaxID=3366185 RepID=UPI0036BD3FDE
MKNPAASLFNLNVTAKLSAALIAGVISCAVAVGGHAAATGGTTWDSPALVAAGTTWDSGAATDGTTWDSTDGTTWDSAATTDGTTWDSTTRL